MNTNNPDILFFVRREYGAPSIELRAYKVEKANEEFAFLELERLRLVVFSGDFQFVSLHHEYGKNNCLYNSANNIPDLMKDMKRWQLSPIRQIAEKYQWRIPPFPSLGGPRHDIHFLLLHPISVL